jgi:hypothetical protein
MPGRKLSEVKEQLRQAISKAKNFSERPDLNVSSWATWFANALDLLDSPDPKAPFHPDMLPNSGFSLDARQILASGTQAYVFSGMGSWNDMGFEQPETHREYLKITNQLYEAVKLGVVAASNSFSL